MSVEDGLSMVSSTGSAGEGYRGHRKMMDFNVPAMIADPADVRAAVRADTLGFRHVDIDVHDIIIIQDSVPDDDPVIETGENILGFAHCCSSSFVVFIFGQNLIYHREGYSS